MLHTRTPYEPVNAILADMLARLQAILGEQLVGFYLYGSLATGDFDPASSDIDFVVATATELDADTVERLRQMHADLAHEDATWGHRLEGAYISVAALRRYDPAYRQPFLSEDTPFGITELGDDWVLNRLCLREHSPVLYGPSPATLVDPVSQEQVAAAVREVMQEFWRPSLETPRWLITRRYQSFAILTMCRALAALESGSLLSKPQAAAWATATLAPQWASLVERAMAWRHDPAEDEVGLQETLAFLRYAVERADAWGRAMDRVDLEDQAARLPGPPSPSSAPENGSLGATPPAS